MKCARSQHPLRPGAGPGPGRYWAAGFIVAMSIALVAHSVVAQDRRPVQSLIEKRQQNVVVQKWDLSCGAAALATLLNYYLGDHISEREIAKNMIKRQEYIDNPTLLRLRQGFSLLDLKLFVETRGYKGIGYGKMTLEDLIQRAPIMVPINTNGYNHFVVFRGIWGDRVLLADPAWGNRTMQVEKFNRLWIDFPSIGRVGFVIEAFEHGKNVGSLSPRPEEFLMLR